MKIKLFLLFVCCCILVSCNPSSIDKEQNKQIGVILDITKKQQENQKQITKDLNKSIENVSSVIKLNKDHTSFTKTLIEHIHRLDDRVKKLEAEVANLKNMR